MREVDPMVKLTFALVILTLFAVAAAFLTIYYQRQDAAEQRANARELLSIQVSESLFKEFDSPEMRKARRAYATELLTEHPAHPKDWRVIDFFDKVGMYAHRGSLDPSIIYYGFSYWIERYWPPSREPLLEFRKRENYDDYDKDFEDLNSEMLNADTSDPAGSSAAPSAAEVDKFLHEEQQLAP